MSLIHNIDHLARAPGVLAVLIDGKPLDGGDLDFRGDDVWRQPLADVLALARSLVPIAELHVSAGVHTLVVQREGGQVAAIVVETGHEIRKSLRRMIRRLAKPAKPPTDKDLAAEREQDRDDIADSRSL